MINVSLDHPKLHLIRQILADIGVIYGGSIYRTRITEYQLLST